MISVSIQDAKNHFSSLLREVERSGEKVIICRHRKAVAELASVSQGGRIKVNRRLSEVGINYDPTSPTMEEWNGA